MQTFRTLTYEAVVVGEEFVSDDFLIKPEDVETYGFAVDDHHPWFTGDSPFGGPIVHPTLLGNQALGMRHSRYVVEAGLHAKMHFEFLRPIRVGMRVRSRGRVIDKYERRGRQYMVTEFVTRQEELPAGPDGPAAAPGAAIGGEAISGGATSATDAGLAGELVRGRFTQMIIPQGRPHAPRHAPGVASSGAPAAPPVAVAGGHRLDPLVKRVSARQIDAYSGVRPRSIHTDEAWARQKGFPGPLAQGMMSTAYVAELMTALAGELFVVGGSLSVAFTQPVVAGDVLTVHGLVRVTGPGEADEADDSRIVDVWCENQRGERTMVGTATAAGPVA